LAGSDLFAIDQRLHPKLQKVVHLRHRFRSQDDALTRPNSVEKLHLANGRKQKTRTRLFGICGGRDDPSGLCERFGKNYAWHERIVGKVTGQHRVIALEGGGTLRRNTRFALDHFVNKNEGRPMGKAENTRIG